MNKICFLIFVVFGFKMLIAQTLTDSLQLSSSNSIHASYIINTKHYNRGIYKTFKEFKFNAPSIVDSFYVDGNNLLLLNKNTGKKKRVNENEIWGYSDGKKVYHLLFKYDELIEIGRYCYFFEEGLAATAGIPPIPKWYKLEYILNFNTGKVYQLTDMLI